MRKLTLQELYDGLQGKGFVRYVDAMARALCDKLEDFDELCWYPLNGEELDKLMKDMEWNAYDLLYYCSDNLRFSLSDSFFRVDEYGEIESIRHEELAILYEDLLFDKRYLELVEEILEEWGCYY